MPADHGLQSMLALINTTWSVSRCFVFDKQLNLRDSYDVKTKAYSNAFSIFMRPTHHLPTGGFQHEFDETKLLFFYIRQKFLTKKDWYRASFVQKRGWKWGMLCVIMADDAHRPYKGGETLLVINFTITGDKLYYY